MAAHILVVEARYYAHIADLQLTGAEAVLAAAGVTHERLTVPGALEIPPAIAVAAQTGRYDGFVALGCVIRGETYHFDLVCNESARGITLLGVQNGLCIGNGILTVEDEAQALRRADPDQLNKGGGAAEAALALVAWRAKVAAS